MFKNFKRSRKFCSILVMTLKLKIFLSLDNEYADEKTNAFDLIFDFIKSRRGGRPEADVTPSIMKATAKLIKI